MTDSAASTPKGGPLARETPTSSRHEGSKQGGSTQGGRRGTAAKSKMPVWLFRTILGASIAAVLVIAYLIISVTVPLMWANSVRDQIGGQLGNSIPLGMFYGFTFSFVPILIAWQAHRKQFNKWIRVSLVVLGLIAAIPNLLTLGVLFGGTQTAADARSIWANSANWFGTWSQLFMVAGVVCAVAVIVLGRMWLQRGRMIRVIKAAEKQVRENQLAQERAAKEASRDAAKQAKLAARAQRRRPGTPSPAEAPVQPSHGAATGRPDAHDGGSPTRPATPTDVSQA